MREISDSMSPKAEGGLRGHLITHFLHVMVLVRSTMMTDEIYLVFIWSSFWDVCIIHGEYQHLY